MSKTLFNAVPTYSVLTGGVFSAVLTFALLAGGTAAVGHEFFASQRAPAEPMPTASVTLPMVVVTGHRLTPTELAAETAVAAPTRIQ